MATCKSCDKTFNAWTSSIGSTVCNECRTNQKAMASPSKPILLFAVGLLAGFFMPWFQMLGVGLSGYQIGRFGSYGNIAWGIPVLATATVLMSLLRMPNRGIGALTGLFPLGALFYALTHFSKEIGFSNTDQMFEIAKHVFSVGGYVTLICSIGLVISSIFIPVSLAQAPHVDRIAQLERLAKLKEEGIISETEFEAEKRKLLN